MKSVEEVARWIIENRRGKAFEGYSPLKILTQITECVENSSMLCITESSEIVGVICCKKDEEQKSLYVYDILTVKPGVVKRMMQFFNKEYAGWTIKGKHRSGRPRHFKQTEKLENRL